MFAQKKECLDRDKIGEDIPRDHNFQDMVTLYSRLKIDSDGKIDKGSRHKKQ